MGEGEQEDEAVEKREDVHCTSSFWPDPRRDKKVQKDEEEDALVGRPQAFVGGRRQPPPPPPLPA